MRRGLGLLLFACVLAHPAPRAAEAAPATPERYVFEPDEAKAAEMLDALLAKHGPPARHAALLKELRGKRHLPRRLKDRDTLSFTCSDGKARTFTYILPPKYKASKPAPVMVWLHGAIRQPAPGGGAGEAEMFRPAVADLGFIVVGPSTFDGVEWGEVACRGLVRHALAWLQENCNVDDNRVYLCGDSDGGRGTYALCETEAGALAAAVPVIGAPGGVTRFLNLRNVPLFAINGGQDSIFKVEHVRSSVEGMQAARIPLTWKLLPDAGHDPRLFLAHQDEVRAFLKEHVRDPFPHAVDWCVDPSRKDPGYPADTFRWVRIEEAGAAQHESAFDDAQGLLAGGLPRVHASYEGNRVELRTRGVKRVTLLVSDEMLDLRKDVEVVVNDRTLFRGKVASDARAILEEARRFKDRALVFSNRLTLDVDAEPVPPPADAEPK